MGRLKKQESGATIFSHKQHEKQIENQSWDIFDLFSWIQLIMTSGSRNTDKNQKAITTTAGIQQQHWQKT